MAGCVALIVAAGRGARLGNAMGPGGSPPKQYLPLAGRPMLVYAVEVFCNLTEVDKVAVVIHGDDRALYAAAVDGLDLLDPVIGGETRQESVRLGLESLSGDGFETILIHDAARPLVGAELISRTIAALASHDGAVPAIAVTDALKRAEQDAIVESVERAGLWRAQTPQGFHFDAILEAHRKAAEGRDLAYGDDAAIATDAGLTVAIVAGDEDNFKVTEGEDIKRAERILAARVEYRTGQGADVHAFGEAGADTVRLCGVDVPHDQGLVGHSDADVGLHAATDAILGALAEGDIGNHFPPGDAAWKDADSKIFLRHAAEIAADRDAIIVHLDVTLICEAPKIDPHRAAMRARIAEILGIDADRVSVKATTTEGLGMIGRGDGIAAQAIATLALKRG
ncbi:MAG: bifunctional 2-C-methyl-D-erythritol 4-phosphate cytidylyltransferase/2-C-methyl-D-erythritol 2,4-cyclodiphosphate synthase [Alphaproteobacteria bacterium]|nr:bifunctional 2-C-methyl-D-erythritol 4-phosphate cytidylyltransferase/2-C-methyl-D-erythritol 2,4-cyclodiphosphate synthase [Alphaproteobacteria bacterium]